MTESTLTRIMNSTLSDYARFCDAGPPDTDAKSFTAHHNAAKAAVTHMMALARLTAWAAENAQDATKSAGHSVEDMLRRARADLNKTEDQDDQEKDQL
jgi:hypothetical protein